MGWQWKTIGRAKFPFESGVQLILEFAGLRAYAVSSRAGRAVAAPKFQGRLLGKRTGLSAFNSC